MGIPNFLGVKHEENNKLMGIGGLELPRTARDEGAKRDKKTFIKKVVRSRGN